MSAGWVAVGRLVRPRGLRGELIAEIYSSQPGRADKLKEVVLELGSRRLPIQVEEVWSHDGRPVFKFAGIDSLSDAEPWRGADILVAEAERAPPLEGEYSHEDLIGCTVFDGEKSAGVVRGVEEYGSASLLRVEAANGHEFLVPFVSAICREIDVVRKIIRADLPEGLTEL